MSIRPSRRFGAFRLALACGVLLLAPAAAEAFTTRHAPRAGTWHGQPAHPAKRMAKRPPAERQAKAAAPAAEPAPAKKPSDHAGTWTAGDNGRACLRSRRKLWQADEGWVVKKVNVCP